MKPKKIIYFSSLLVLFLCGLVLFFSLKDTGEKPEKTKPGEVLPSNRKIPESADKRTTLTPSSVPDEKEKAQTGKWHGVILPGNPITLYAPERGVLHLFVKSGDRINRGDILVKITNPNLLESIEKQKAIYEEEIDQKFYQIESARDDIIRIKEEISNIEAKLLEAEQAHYSAEIDYKRGLSDSQTLNESKEDIERLNAHLMGGKQMMEVKYREIGEYEERIQELQTTLKKPPEHFAINAPFDGLVSVVLSESGESVEKSDPLFEINPENIINVKVEGKIPLSLDQGKIFFSFDRFPSKQYSGILQIESLNYQNEDQGEEAIIRIILEPAPEGLSFEATDKITFWFQ